MQISDDVMGKFLLKIGFFFLILLFLDRFIGCVFNNISNHIYIGGTGRDNYICNIVDDDIIVLGSSRAEHHYNAQMITDSLGQSCYNCGESGCGILLAYGRLKMIRERKIPSLIIYEITPNYDYLAGEDNHKYLYRLKQHYDRNGIDSIFFDVDWREKYKMKSLLYRHNSSFFQNMLVYFGGVSTESGDRGFRPIKQEFNKMKIRKDLRPIFSDVPDEKCDPIKIDYLVKFLNLCKGSKVIFVYSPVWYGANTKILTPIKEISKQFGCELLDFSNDKKYVHNDLYFNDGNHLNERGANEFTKDLIKELKKKFEFPKDSSN